MAMTLSSEGRSQSRCRSPLELRVRSLTSSFTDKGPVLLDERFRRQLQQPVEYVWSSEFECPEVSAAILEEPVEDGCRTASAAPVNTPPFLAALYCTPLLTPDQEFRRFRQMNFWKHRAEMVRRSMLATRVTRRRRCEFEACLQNAGRVRNSIVEANLRLVVSIAKTLVDEANPLEDLVSDGNVPLMRAAEIFDFTRGLRFSTYATWAIRNCLFRSCPRNRRRWQRFSTGDDGAFVGLADRSAAAATAANREPIVAEQIQTLLQTLPERDRRVIEARFGLGGRLTSAKFREIASELNLSTERVRQLLAKALDRLRVTIADSAMDLAMT